MYPSLPVLTAAQMRACDTYTIQEKHIPSRVLMERAAGAVVKHLLAHPEDFPDGPVVVLCGGGNNGGDGFAAAHLLRNGSCGARRPVRVLYLGHWDSHGQPDTNRMSPACAWQYARAVSPEATTSETLPPIPVLPLSRAEHALEGATAVIDAVFGIGMDRPVEADLAALFRSINTQESLPVLSIDIPSGVMADTGAVPGEALCARTTVTMQALKRGHLLYPGADVCGKLVVADLGIDLSPLQNQPLLQLVGDDLLRTALPPRRRRSHKGTYGCLSLVCGSYGMAGAALLSAGAALRGGAGLAQVITPEENRLILQTALPEAVLALYDASGASPSPIRPADGYVMGCGLGTSPTSALVLDTCLRQALSDQDRPPLVLDADALTLLARHPHLMALLSDAAEEDDRTCRTVLTPHPAEMARLCNRPIAEILADLPGTALDYAKAHRVVVVLKDAHTIIAEPSGRLWVCAAGNAGMAKGGSGDILAGLLGALLIQHRQALRTGTASAGELAAAGVLLHAMAADHAAVQKGEYALLPSDILSSLPAVTQSYSDSRTRLTQG